MDAMREVWIGVPVWKWAAFLLVFLMGLVLRRLGLGLIRLQESDSDDKLSTSMMRELRGPVGTLLMLGFYKLGLGALGIPEVIQTEVVFVGKALLLWVFFSTAWGLARVVALSIQRSTQRSDFPIDPQIVPIIQRTLRGAIGVIAILTFLDLAGVNVAGLLAGLGVGGLAVALAAKESIANLFGFFMILIDRSFRVGDSIVVTGIEGRVEEIGFRSTRLRTPVDSIVLIPNSNIVSGSIENLGQRQVRRIRNEFAISGSNATELIALYEKTLVNHCRAVSFLVSDRTNIWIEKISGERVDMVLQTYIHSQHVSEENKIKHQLLLDCLEIGQRLGIRWHAPNPL